MLVNEDLGGDDGAKWLECLAQVRVGELLGLGWSEKVGGRGLPEGGGR